MKIKMVLPIMRPSSFLVKVLTKRFVIELILPEFDLPAFIPPAFILPEFTLPELFDDIACTSYGVDQFDSKRFVDL